MDSSICQTSTACPAKPGGSLRTGVVKVVDYTADHRREMLAERHDQRLRPSNIDASAGCREKLEQIVGQLRHAYRSRCAGMRASAGKS